MPVLRAKSIKIMLSAIKKYIYERQMYQFNEVNGGFIIDSKTGKRVRSGLPSDYCKAVSNRRYHEIDEAFVQDISKWDFSGIKHCLTTRESSEQNCITYIFSYSNINLERKEKYGWLETMFEDEYVLCNIDDNDCSLYGD